MLSWALQMEPESHSSAFTSYLKFSSQLKRQSICSCTKRKQDLINEVPRKKTVPALAHSPVQGGKDEELGLAGYEDSKSPVSQAGGLGSFQPPLRFIDHALSEEV